MDGSRRNRRRIRSRKGFALDGVFATSERAIDEFWTVRELIPEANRRIGSISSHDISVPIGSIPLFINQAGSAIASIGRFRINCFGHVGDGNLHFNIFPPEGRKASEFAGQRAEIRQAVHDAARSLDGSISAEHGTGRLKAGELAGHGDPSYLDALRRIKKALDPPGIMNPGAILEIEQQMPHRPAFTGFNRADGAGR